MTPADFAVSDMEALRDRLRQRTGLIFPESRRQDLEAAVQRTMTLLGVSGYGRFADRLDGDDRAFDTLIADITVGETYFFREPAQMDILRRRVLPDLVRRLSGHARLRLWSAGCASGEEPYSLAILLEQEGLAGQASILGTDLSRAALARAKEGRYGIWSLRGNLHAAASHFDRDGDGFVLKERFRRRVDFRFLNLASGTYPSAENGTAEADLILCRNVLIYLDADTVRRVAQRFFASLRDGGWLLTGPSDPPLWDHAPFQTRVTDAGVLYQRGGDAEPRIAVRILDLPIADPQPEWPSVAPPAAEPAITPAPPAPTEAAPSPALEAAPETWIAKVRLRADRGETQSAELEAMAALRDHPLVPELHYLLAIVLVELRRHDEAVAALRRVIYLDPSLAIAWFTLGSVLARTDAAVEARRSYQNALALCRSRPAGEILPLSEGEPVRNLVASIEAQLKLVGVSS